MERRILLASAFALTTFAAISASIGGCGLEEYGLPLFGDASVLDGFSDDGSSSDSSSPRSDGSATVDDGSTSGEGSTDGGIGDSSAGDGTTTTTCATGFSCGVLGCLSDCRACVGSPLACATTKTCESNCAGCGTHDVECYLCDSGLPVGRCDTNSASECLGANYQHCSCAILPCLTLSQVCVDDPSHGIHNECRTCGEDRTNGGGCGVFQHCSESAATCN